MKRGKKTNKSQPSTPIQRCNQTAPNSSSTQPRSVRPFDSKIPKFKHAEQGNDQRIPSQPLELLYCLPPPHLATPHIKSKAPTTHHRLIAIHAPPYLVEAKAEVEATGGGVPASPPRLLAEMGSRRRRQADGGRIWADPRRIYLAALAGRVRREGNA